MKILHQTLLHFLLGTTTCLGQGGFLFANNGANFGARAPVYSTEPSNPYLQLWGNPPNATPPGSQTYSGPLLVGTNYSVEAWYTLAPVADPLQLIPDARPVASSLTLFRLPSAPGFFAGQHVLIPDPNPSQTTEYPYYVYLQVRAWDNANGQYPTWTEAWSAANQGSGRAVGWSTIFYQPLDRDSSTLPWPGLINFESFNLFIVPEPASASLLILGVTSLWLFRDRRPHRAC